MPRRCYFTNPLSEKTQSPYHMLRSKLPNSFFAGYKENVHKVIINYTHNKHKLNFYCIDMPAVDTTKPLFWREHVSSPILFATRKLYENRAEWEDEIWFYLMGKNTVGNIPIVITTPSRMLPAVKYGLYTPPDIMTRTRLKGYDTKVFNTENMKAVRSERATVHRILVSAIQDTEQQNI